MDQTIDTAADQARDLSHERRTFSPNSARRFDECTVERGGLRDRPPVPPSPAYDAAMTAVTAGKDGS